MPIAINDLNLNDYKFTVLRTEPWVILIHNFLSDDEVESLLRTSEGRFKRSYVVGSENATAINDKRTSTSCMFAKSETAVLAAIEDRVAKITGMPKENMEPYQLVKYEHAQEYASHFDWFNTREPYAREEVERRGQRCLTILAYLMEPLSGGDTFFPRIKLYVPPVKKSAVLWFNTDKNGKEDELTEHGGMPVFNGTKVAMNIWIRDKEYV